MPIDRRRFLMSGALAAAAASLPPAIARALEIPASRCTGTISDVAHVVILMQENRSFDHYFGTMRGVRGFGDRFAIPARDATVFVQPDEDNPDRSIAPFRLDTTKSFAEMRVSGTPHTFPDAQDAWDNGRMDNWTGAKKNHAMGYYTREDIPFQYALAEAFTLCDAYHCAMHAGTNPNRVFHWTGTNDALARHHGPVIDNGYDELKADPKGHGGYAWVTYPERLTAAGVSWQVYQDMDDNFTDNPLAGFKLYRMAAKAKSGPLAELAARSLTTRDLDKLKADVLANTLPQVSWIVATAEGSEHPGPSSPAQGADYTARVLDALTANPEVWARTVLLINFDENDGFFDHVPPPAPPSAGYGESQIDTAGEYHPLDDKWKGRPYGLGPRVPMYVVSPWSKGGFINSQVFDHTSVIRFLETRFGVHEPNISAWRRAVCGDLTTCFDFDNPDQAFITLPETAGTAKRAKGYLLTKTPRTPEALVAPVQETGTRPARPLPYRFSVTTRTVNAALAVELANDSKAVAAVFHVYDHLQLGVPPKRLTVKAGGKLTTSISAQNGVSSVSVHGPNGFYRACHHTQPNTAAFSLDGSTMTLNAGEALSVTLKDEAYGQPTQVFDLFPGVAQTVTLDLSSSHNWYDFSLSGAGFHQRFAGHVEDGKPSMSDPAMGGPAPLALPSPLPL